jgi:hypothetical protein
MRASYIFILVFIIPQCILSLSPPKQRPSRSNAPDAQPSSDSSIIVPLYKEALKADAEGRPEDSLRLLSTPPLSLAPGILSTCCPPLPPPPTPSHQPSISCGEHVTGCLRLVSQHNTIVHEAASLGRGRAAHSRCQRSGRDELDVRRTTAPTIFRCNHISCFPGIWPSCLRVAASSIHPRGCCCRSGSRAGAAT